MFYTGWDRPLSNLEDLELRRDRLAELIRMDLVSVSLSEQIKKAIIELEMQIQAVRQNDYHREAA